MNKLIKLCQDVVRFKSDENNNRDCQMYMKKYLEDIGFSAELITLKGKNGIEVDNLYASIGSGKPHLLFVGHSDVVPAGKGWTHEPFAAEIDNGVLYARGIADMKGGIACFMDAVDDFLKSETFKGKISFIICGDEEEPLVEGVKSLLEMKTKEGEVFDFCLVGEPSNANYIGEEIKVGRRGDVILKIKSIGTQGHTAYPNDNNPAHNLMDLLTSIRADKLDEGNEYFWPSSLHVTTFDVGNKASNVVPGEANAQIDIRFNSLHSGKSIIERIEKHIAKAKGKFELETEIIGESFLSPYDANVKLLEQSIKELADKEPKLFTSGGTSDARFVKDYCPVVEFGLINKTIHKVDECASIEDIELVQKIFKRFLSLYFN